MTETKRIGRPPIENPKVTTSIRIPPDMLEYLRENGVNATVEQAVARSKGFKDWKRANA